MDIERDLSPTAELLLRRLQAEPDRLRYDIQLFGDMTRPEHHTLLDQAYEQLELAGLVERSGSIVRYFGTPKRLYRLSAKGRQLAGADL